MVESKSLRHDGDRLLFGPVHLEVTDIRASAAFWRRVVGLEVRQDEEFASQEHAGNGGQRECLAVALGTRQQTLVVLHSGAAKSVQSGCCGLYHLAIHVPTVLDFAHAWERIQGSGVPFAAVDHLLSMALYLSDPDGIGIELTLETPERGTLLGKDPRGMPRLVDLSGRPHSGREQLVPAAIFNALECSNDPSAGPLTRSGRFTNAPQTEVAEGTKIGHIHLHVRNLDEAYRFYRDEVGFLEGHVFEGIRMAELHAGGLFQHRMALNNWQGERAAQRPAGTAGLRYFTLIPARGLERWNGPLELRDPSGNTVRFLGRLARTQTTSRKGMEE